MKRIVTIQDISCVGKCSLTVALPIISAMGVECSILPTAVLSTHTMFKGWTFRDLTDDIKPIGDHWNKEKFGFDAIYTGYLGSEKQLSLVSDFISEFKNGDKTIVFVDPVMADNGKLYPGFTESFVKKMARLVGKADIVVPNMTEASFLLGIPYKEKGYDENYVKDILRRLSDLGCPKTVLTGVNFGPGALGVMCYNAETGGFYRYMHRKINVSFHGTGDIYSSTAVGALMNGMSLEKSLSLAADYTVECIDVTMKDPKHESYGVEFEKAIPWLVDRMRGE